MLALILSLVSNFLNFPSKDMALESKENHGELQEDERRQAQCFDYIHAVDMQQ